MYVVHAEVVLPNVKTMAVFLLIFLLFLKKNSLQSKFMQFAPNLRYHLYLLNRYFCTVLTKNAENLPGNM